MKKRGIGGHHRPTYSKTDIKSKRKSKIQWNIMDDTDTNHTPQPKSPPNSFDKMFSDDEDDKILGEIQKAGSGNGTARHGISLKRTGKSGGSYMPENESMISTGSSLNLGNDEIYYNTASRTDTIPSESSSTSTSKGLGKFATFFSSDMEQKLTMLKDAEAEREKRSIDYANNLVGKLAMSSPANNGTYSDSEKTVAMSSPIRKSYVNTIGSRSLSVDGKDSRDENLTGKAKNDSGKLVPTGVRRKKINSPYLSNLSSNPPSQTYSSQASVLDLLAETERKVDEAMSKDTHDESFSITSNKPLSQKYTEAIDIPPIELIDDDSITHETIDSEHDLLINVNTREGYEMIRQRNEKILDKGERAGYPTTLEPSNFKERISGEIEKLKDLFTLGRGKEEHWADEQTDLNGHTDDNTLKPPYYETLVKTKLLKYLSAKHSWRQGLPQEKAIEISELQLYKAFKDSRPLTVNEIMDLDLPADGGYFGPKGRSIASDVLSDRLSYFIFKKAKEISKIEWPLKSKSAEDLVDLSIGDNSLNAHRTDSDNKMNNPPPRLWWINVFEPGNYIMYVLVPEVLVRLIKQDLDTAKLEKEASKGAKKRSIKRKKPIPKQQSLNSYTNAHSLPKSKEFEFSTLAEADQVFREGTKYGNLRFPEMSDSDLQEQNTEMRQRELEMKEDEQDDDSLENIITGSYLLSSSPDGGISGSTSMATTASTSQKKRAFDSLDNGQSMANQSSRLLRKVEDNSTQQSNVPSKRKKDNQKLADKGVIKSTSGKKQTTLSAFQNKQENTRENDDSDDDDDLF